MSSDLTWLPAWSIQKLITDREVSPVEVVNHFLGRIEEHNGTLNAFKSIDEEGAHEQAKRAEAAVRRGDDLGSLHGIPISIKEYIPVEGLPFHDDHGADWGNSKHDALGVARLREAGAVIVGTNTAMGITEALLNPYDCELEARNPWDTKRVTGWSSSGSGAQMSYPIGHGSRPLRPRGRRLRRRVLHAAGVTPDRDHLQGWFHLLPRHSSPLGLRRPGALGRCPGTGTRHPVLW